MVIKHAQPYAKGIPSMGYPAERMNIAVKIISFSEMQPFLKIGRDSNKTSICPSRVLFINIPECAKLLGHGLLNFISRQGLRTLARVAIAALLAKI